jgi:alpha-tubulin suppressor-like RCC1 family protein|tara:strand:+ start:432 stop:611 length:180 start_codon:yes stop_codon:yes gene_type:complete
MVFINNLLAGVAGSQGGAGGALYSWGANGHGQLGLGDTTLRNSPVQIGTESHDGIKGIK